jgi:hypothetical protein
MMKQFKKETRKELRAYRQSIGRWNGNGYWHKPIAAFVKE